MPRFDGFDLAFAHSVNGARPFSDTSDSTLLREGDPDVVDVAHCDTTHELAVDREVHS